MRTMRAARELADAVSDAVAFAFRAAWVYDSFEGWVLAKTYSSEPSACSMTRATPLRRAAASLTSCFAYYVAWYV